MGDTLKSKYLKFLLLAVVAFVAIEAKAENVYYSVKPKSSIGDKGFYCIGSDDCYNFTTNSQGLPAALEIYLESNVFVFGGKSYVAYKYTNSFDREITESFSLKLDNVSKVSIYDVIKNCLWQNNICARSYQSWNKNLDPIIGSFWIEKKPMPKKTPKAKVAAWASGNFKITPIQFRASENTLQRERSFSLYITGPKSDSGSSTALLGYGDFIKNGKLQNFKTSKDGAYLFDPSTIKSFTYTKNEDDFSNDQLGNIGNFVISVQTGSWGISSDSEKASLFSHPGFVVVIDDDIEYTFLVEAL